MRRVAVFPVPALALIRRVLPFESNMACCSSVGFTTRYRSPRNFFVSHRAHGVTEFLDQKKSISVISAGSSEVGERYQYALPFPNNQRLYRHILSVNLKGPTCRLPDGESLSSFFSALSCHIWPPFFDFQAIADSSFPQFFQKTGAQALW